MTKVLLPNHQDYIPTEAGGAAFYIGADVSDYARVIPLLVHSFNKMRFHDLIGLKVVAIDGKQVIAVIEKSEKLHGHPGLLHGGVISACLDAVGGYKAIHEIYLRADNTDLVRIGQRTMRLRTKDIHVEYLDAARGDWYQIAASTVSYQLGTMVNEMTMVDNTGRLIAKGAARYVELSALGTR